MPNTPLRSSHEPGHHRRMLMIVDESPESETALYFCASRIAHTSGSIVLLFNIEPLPNLMGVGAVHIDEQTNRGKALFRLARNKLNAVGYQNVVMHEVIVQGKTSEAIVKVIQEDLDIGILVLGAAVDKRGPGPLVTALAAKAAGNFPIPITIVPGSLSLEELKALA